MTQEDLHLSKEVVGYLKSKISTLRPSGTGLLGLCIYHSERTPSMFIYYDDSYNHMWWFKCQGCGKTGPLNMLLKKLKGTQYLLPERKRLKPLQIIKKERRVVNETLVLPRHYWYFNQRGVSDAICKLFDFRMDYLYCGAIMPIYFQKTYKGFIRRNFGNDGPKYHISKYLDISQCFWGYDEAIKHRGQTIYITEGIIDAAVLWSSGFPAIALLGKNYITKLCHLHTSRHKYKLSYCIYPDNDREGLSLAKNLSRDLGASIRFIDSKYKDVSEQYIY